VWALARACALATVDARVDNVEAIRCRFRGQPSIHRRACSLVQDGAKKHAPGVN
jgi:hypothetical protein